MNKDNLLVSSPEQVQGFSPEETYKPEYIIIKQ